MLLLFILFSLITIAITPFAYGAYGDHDGQYGENDGIHGGNCLKPQNYPQMDSRIKGWATSVIDYWRPEGLTHGTPEIVLGQPGGTFHVLSLGDGGWIIVTFDLTIANGPGPDFVVWENGFISRQPGTKTLLWAELMFAEVSTDGVNFARFPSVCLNPEGHVGGFGCIDPTYYHNVAGKHPNGNDGRDEGTPFDLDDLLCHPFVIDGTVDLNNIQYVKLIDVVGDGSTFDSEGRPMLDPYPTPFGTGGADLDAVAAINVQSSYVPPDQPTLSFPGDKAEGISLSLTLETGPFSDEDNIYGDFHSRTRWQISKDPGFSELLLDETTSVSLTSLLLPGSILKANTIYYWHVQFYDSASYISEWSETFSFTTTNTSNDIDPPNGIPDDQELKDNAIDHNVDLNRNRIPDIVETNDHFKVLNTVVGNGQMGVSVPDHVTIEYLESIDPETLPDIGTKPDDMLLSLISFRLKVQDDSTTITVYLSESAPDGYKWYKYDLTKGWYPFSNANFSSDRRSLTLTLTDGGDGDLDGVKNGFIIDPGGVGKVSGSGGSSTPSSSSSDSGFEGVGGCFIATAAYGSYMEPHVKILRDFRDTYMLPNRPGRSLVNAYYRYSPQIADYIAQHSILKAAVRIGLAPVVGISYVMLHTTAMQMAGFFLLLLGVSLITWLILRTSRRKVQMSYKS